MPDPKTIQDQIYQRYGVGEHASGDRDTDIAAGIRMRLSENRPVGIQQRQRLRAEARASSAIDGGRSVHEQLSKQTIGSAPEGIRPAAMTPADRATFSAHSRHLNQAAHRATQEAHSLVADPETEEEPDLSWRDLRKREQDDPLGPGSAAFAGAYHKYISLPASQASRQKRTEAESTWRRPAPPSSGETTSGAQARYTGSREGGRSQQATAPANMRMRMGTSTQSASPTSKRGGPSASSGSEFDSFGKKRRTPGIYLGDNAKPEAPKNFQAPTKAGIYQDGEFSPVGTFDSGKPLGSIVAQMDKARQSTSSQKPREADELSLEAYHKGRSPAASLRQTPERAGSMAGTGASGSGDDTAAALQGIRPVGGGASAGGAGGAGSTGGASAAAQAGKEHTNPSSLELKGTLTLKDVNGQNMGSAELDARG